MITVKYSKLNDARFLSHLDMQTILQRTIKRAGFTPVFTMGFNPRPVFKMSKPLPLGVASRCEYFSVDIHDISREDFLERAKLQTPKGIELLNAWITEKDPKVYNLGVISEYEIKSEHLNYNKIEKLKEKIKTDFIIPKKQKKKYIDENVSDLIFDIKYIENKTVVCLMSDEGLNLRINDFLNGVNYLFSINISIKNAIKTAQYINKKMISIDTYLSTLAEVKK
ncbi:MAG TPA: DUF2344 domain-containing protein [Clostridiales bacterium]|nr:DUF2344 domain-containing protein [Clostridiales bacterium]